MGLTVQKKFFERREQVFEDLAQTGHWPTTFVSGASPELPLHWHDLDVSGYVIEGTTYLVDEAGQHHALEPGDKLNIPRGTLHAEGAVVGEVIYIVGTETPGSLRTQLALLDPVSYTHLTLPTSDLV